MWQYGIYDIVDKLSWVYEAPTSTSWIREKWLDGVDFWDEFSQSRCCLYGAGYDLSKIYLGCRVPSDYVYSYSFYDRCERVKKSGGPKMAVPYVCADDLWLGPDYACDVLIRAWEWEVYGYDDSRR